MDALQKQLQDALEGQIDFQGQRFTELISTVMLIVTSALALLVGFLQKDIHLTMWITLAGTLITLLIVVPPWPLFNRKPQPWLGSRMKVSQIGHVQGVKMS